MGLRGRWFGRVQLMAVCTAMVVPIGLSGGPARADEVYPRPTDDVVHLTGHGYGHGRGMSQYGALGGAKAGKTWPQILAFYYPGSTLSSIGDPVIRVRIASLGDTVQALPQTGLQVVWTGIAPYTLPTSVTVGGVTDSVARWRLLDNGENSSTGSRVTLQYLVAGTSSTWKRFSASPDRLAAFRNPTSGTVTTLRVSTQVAYRGDLRAALVGDAFNETLIPVAALPMEDYLRSVVPNEMPALWDQDAVAAQAVAARSYAEYHRRYAPLSPPWYDVYDDTRSQVFPGTSVGGTSKEHPASDQAIRTTAKQAAFYGSRVALTEFSSSSGGWTATGSQPYLVAKADPWDAVPDNPNHTWEAQVTAASFERAYPSIGTYLRLRITDRTGQGDMGGRVTRAVVEGTAGSINVTGGGLRAALGLKSDWFRPVVNSFPRDVTSDGKADVLGVYGSKLYVYPGDGTGGWGTRVSAGTGWDAYRQVLTAGTWDGDGYGDVIYETAGGDLFLRPGLGNGTFGTAVRIGNGWGVHNLVLPLGDFNGDGYADLAARRASDGALFLYAGNGTGRFRAATQIGTGWQNLTAVFSAGDVDGDGAVDILGRGRDGTLILYRGNGSGRFAGARVIGSSWSGFTALTSPGDFDGDGKPDVIARTSSGLLYLYRGDGSGGWLGRRTIGSGWSGFSRILL